MNQAIVFDFDDTLVYTNILFDEIKAAFYRRMAALSLWDEELPDTLNRFDIQHVQECGGFSKECFPLALRRTYGEYCRIKGLPYSRQQAEDFENLGWQVFEKPVQPVSGCIRLLEDLQQHYKLFLLTQGDAHLQKERLERSGLLKYFLEYAILHCKSSAAFIRPLKKHRLKAGACWSVGNSLRSDIKPALRAGLKAIHIQHASWDYDNTNRQGFYHQAAALEDCRLFLLK